MDQKAERARYLRNLEEERNSTYLYRALSEHEENPRLAEVYRKLAEAEEHHADLWAGKLAAAGAKVPPFRPAVRTRLLAWLSRSLGPEMVVPTLSAKEETASGDYGSQPDAADLIPTEQSHARVLRQIVQNSGGVGGSALAQLEGRHRMAGGNALRAAVLGASDGLLSNFNLIMGVAGAQLANRSILLTGCAGMLAGAISMALGEWISVQSSRELYQRHIETEREEIENAPEEEVEELVLIYQARGIDEPTARQIAGRIMDDRENALGTLVREELGVDPEELGGSAWVAAITSFLLFAAGAVIPIIPFLFMSGAAAVVTSAAFSAVGLFAVGAAITLFTGRPVFYAGMRQVGFGLIAAAVTYLVGRLVGGSLAG
ncbi:VIT1/CCC1 transporter family protein [Geomesophilobacter sediminis]|uniref:VIT1/CCC1 transporter family protein n=1 Tax=Geomesophilobacter sediminis TaxID=2798584 RepID=A0A8J7LTM4_9BACT|nr:VIT1/CCC1 transporter family protein [Geomesophilobacter sediminis]MBJ6723599.1 VIT1/CCC1 transporter family protein [Geomesophilobacter sediminis]